MVVTNNFTEAELEHYVTTLKKANKGGKVDATINELAIISVGVSQTWEIAKQMYAGGGAVGKRTGDSATLTDETSARGLGQSHAEGDQRRGRLQRGAQALDHGHPEQGRGHRRRRRERGDEHRQRRRRRRYRR